MLYTLAAVFMILWVLGVVTGYTAGGFIHLFLTLAIIFVLLRLICGNDYIDDRY